MSASIGDPPGDPSLLFKLIYQSFSDFLFCSINCEIKHFVGIQSDRYYGSVYAAMRCLRLFTVVVCLVCVLSMHPIEASLTLVCLAFVTCGIDTNAQHQKDQLYFMLVLIITLYVYGWHGATEVLVIAATDRALTLNSSVACYLRAFAQPIRFIDGTVVGYPDETASDVDPDLAAYNTCAWKLLFEDYSRAQLELAKLEDGRMTTDQLYKYGCGRINLYTAQGRYSQWPMEDHLPNVYVDNGHASFEVPDDVLSWTTDDWYDGEPIGYVLPQPRPTMRRHAPVREALLEKIERADKLRSGDDHVAQMAEFAVIAGMEELDVIDELLSLPKMTDLVPLDIRKLYLSNEKFHIFDTFRNVWLGRKAKIEESPITDGSTLMWTGTNFVHAQWSLRKVTKVFEVGGRAVKKPRYLLLMKDLPYRRGDAILDTFEVLKSQPRHHCESRANNGVPSCGKSTMVAKNCAEHPENKAICQGHDQMVDLVNRGCDAYTIDSVLVNRPELGNVRLLSMDESSLMHAGAIEMAIQIMKPDRVEAYGDVNQIPFVCRVNGFHMVHDDYTYTEEPNYQTTAHLTPKVICDILRPLYAKLAKVGEDAYVWASGVVGSAATVKISSVYNVPLGFSVYLTYTQGEKATLQGHLIGSRVMTVHESEGLRFRNVALVRLKTSNISIYNKQPYNIVAISRTTHNFRYFTVGGSDMMSTWLRDKVATPFDDHKHETEEAEPYFETGGAYTPLRLRNIKLNRSAKHETWNAWRRMIGFIGPNLLSSCLVFSMWWPLARAHYWVDVRPSIPHHVELQATLDSMFHRTDRDVAKVDRYEWPIKWPEKPKLDMVKSASKAQVHPRPSLHPVLATPQGPRAHTHPADLARACTQRVLNNPKQRLDYAPERSYQMVEDVKNLLNLPKLEELNITMPLESKELSQLWYATRNDRRRSAILTANPLILNLAKYYVMVRGDHKPKLDDGHSDNIDSGQLVTANAQFWTSLFAPIFQTMLIKLIAVLDPNIVLHTRMTWEELSAHIDARLSGVEFKALELDVGKFDKSQDRALLEYQCLMFELLGMPEWMTELWKTGHELCLLASPKFGVTYTVGFQRRSGDALTWFGNTLVLLGMTAMLYDLKRAHLAVLSGDDNLIAFRPTTVVLDQSARAADELNFEIKPLMMSTSMYFSSRFIILTRFGWITVADPVKLIVRLGRHDLQGREHLKAIHDSWRSMHYMYKDPEVRAKAAEAAEARYSRVLGRAMPSMAPFVNAIAAIVNDYKILESFYFGTTEEWNLKLDPNERVGDGFYETLLDVFVDNF